LGNLYFDDYCIWAQKAEASVFVDFAAALRTKLESTGIQIIEGNEKRAHSSFGNSAQAKAWSTFTGWPLLQLERVALEWLGEPVR
jgi:hypothetical protein